MSDKNLVLSISNVSVIGLTLVIGIVVFIVCSLCSGGNKKTEEESEQDEGEKRRKGVSKTATKQKQKLPVKNKQQTFSFAHPLLHTALKGHGGNILDIHFSINGKYLATASEDRTVRLWSVKDFGTGNKCVRVNIELDHAKRIEFSPDSKAFVVALADGNKLGVYKMGKKDDGTVLCSPVDTGFVEDYKEDLLNIGIGASASGGSFLMTAYKDTTIHVRNIKGEILNTINTNLGNNNHAKVSPCGRFVAACGWTPDIKVWEVVFNKSGDYKEVIRAFELKGHTSSIWSFDFNNDSTRMVSISKDGTWRSYNTDIEHRNGQEPYLLNSGNFSGLSFSPTEHMCLSCLSYDGNVAAFAVLNNIVMVSTRTGKFSEEFKEVHSELISCLSFSINGKYLVSGGDKHVRVFHNTLGYKETIKEMKEKLKKLPTASATRERLEQQIKIANESLDKILAAA